MQFQANLRVNVDGEWKIVVVAAEAPARDCPVCGAKPDEWPLCDDRTCALKYHQGPPDSTTEDFLKALAPRRLHAFVRDQHIVIEVAKRKRSGRSAVADEWLPKPNRVW